MRPDTFTAVSVHDPAIDTKRMTRAQLMEYANKRDPKLLKLAPGAHPTVFHCREVPHALMLDYVLAGDMSDAERARRCFVAGVMEVTDLHERDGVRQPKYRPAREERVDVMQEEELGKFSASEVLEIGSCIFWHSFFPPRTAPSYPLPPLSHITLTVREFLPADALQDEPAPSSEQASGDTGSVHPASPTTETDTPDAGSPSDSPTGATAPETP